MPDTPVQPDPDEEAVERVLARVREGMQTTRRPRRTTVVLVAATALVVAGGLALALDRLHAGGDDDVRVEVRCYSEVSDDVGASFPGTTAIAASGTALEIESACRALWAAGVLTQPSAPEPTTASPTAPPLTACLRRRSSERPVVAVFPVEDATVCADVGMTPLP